jgi:hypothetical protein
VTLPLVAHAEQGVLGATVGIGEAGSGSPWDAVVGTPTITYDNAHAYGRMAYKVAGGASAQQLVWTSASVGTAAELWGRFYLWSSAAPSATTGILRFTVGGSQAARLRYEAAGTLSIADGGNSPEVTTANPIPTGQWIRVEWHIQFIATGATVELRTYNNADSTVATETLSVTAAGVGVNCDRIEVGSFNAVTWTGWLDNLQVNATGFPGPVPPAPAVRALRPQTRALLVR